MTLVFPTFPAAMAKEFFSGAKRRALPLQSF